MAFCGKIHGLAYGGYIGNCRFSVALVNVQAHFHSSPDSSVVSLDIWQEINVCDLSPFLLRR